MSYPLTEKLKIELQQFAEDHFKFPADRLLFFETYEEMAHYGRAKGIVETDLKNWRKVPAVHIYDAVECDGDYILLVNGENEQRWCDAVGALSRDELTKPVLWMCDKRYMDIPYFFLLHEIGHWTMNHRGLDKKQEEIEANQFAVEQLESLIHDNLE